VRNIALATAVAATLALAAPQSFAQSKGSASKAEVQAIEAQMKALAERLNRLESANTALQTQNAELKAVVDRRDAEIDYLKSQTRELREEGAVASNEISKVKGSDWAARIKGRGDLRYRHEYIGQEAVFGTGSTATVDDAADRNRQRIRARLGFDAQVTDHVKATLLLATGGTDPRSSNQTLGDSNSRKSVGVDMAYADWAFMPGGNLILGKQSWPFWRPGQSLFFDGDYNPEGGAVKFERGMLFGSAYGWWLSEQWNASETGENSDGNIFGAQAGLKFPLLGGETRVAAHYFNCGACQDQTSILFNNNANGNTTYRVGNGTANFLKYDYDVVQLSAEMGVTLFDQPFSVWVDYATNTADDVEYDTAYAAGVSLGRASNPRTWNAAAWYQSLDKDALFAQLVDSDFGDGRTDSEGWVLRGAYAPVRNFNIQATYFINTLNKDVAPVSGDGYAIGQELDYDRLQLDLNYRF
jgi:hypothetical protein